MLRNPHVSDYLNRHGIPELSLQEALELPDRLLRSESSQSTAMRMDREQWAAANPRRKNSLRYSEILT